MTQQKVPYKNLPQPIKVALWLSGIHVLLFSEAFLEYMAIPGAVRLNPLYLFAGVTLMLELSRPSKATFYLVTIFSMLLSILMLSGNLVVHWATPEGVTVLIRSLLYCLPLFLVGPLVIAQRSFYLGPHQP